MRKIYYLSSCSTSKRIIEDFKLKERDFSFQDIKTEKLTAKELEQLAKLAGSYEALFSRIARKYRALNLHEQNLTEDDYKGLILEEYTFLKRPVIVIDKKIFVGSGKPNLQRLAAELA